MGNPLHRLMSPRSIATVGAGNNPMKMGAMQALSILKDGYAGKFYPVHPTETTVLGHPAYPSVAALPEAPDLAMLVVPTSQVPGLLEDFGRLGTKRAIVISAGFKETGDSGRDMERRLNEIAARYGMRFLGPNCMGIINGRLSLNVTVAGLASEPGSLGLASQSGTYVTQTLPYLRRRGIRFSKAISVGNEANIDIVDALEYLGEDEDTKAIILYIEGIRDGRRFLEVAQGIASRKPLLAQYVGGSAAGARAGLSHTGALAGPAALYEGIFRQAGIIQAYSIEDLYGHGWALATQPPLQGNRIGVVTNSGGPGTAISHNADLGGLEVPRFSEELQAKIRALIPPHAASANPVDITFSLDMELLSATIPELILASGEVDGLVLHGAMGTGFMKSVYPHVRELLGGISQEEFLSLFLRDLSASVSLPQRFAKPLIVSSFLEQDDNYAAAYQQHDIPVFDGPEKAARAMASLLRHKEIRERKAPHRPPLPPANPEAAALLQEARRRGQTALDEHAAKQVLAAYGIPVTRERLVRDEDEALAAAAEIGFPVAVKACSWEILHKTGKGLLRLRLQNGREVCRAVRAVRKAAGGPVPILVQEMVDAGRELVAGMTRFPGFGPCVLFGLGGIFTEALRDRTFRAAPLGMAEAEEMLADIRAKALLGAFRGMPAADAPALARILQAVGWIGLLHPEIAEMDLNPVILAGARPVVADALCVLGGPG